PWTLLLLLLGPQPLGSHIWGPAEKEGDDEERLLKNYLPATMEYALHMYNLTNQGRNAYKVVRVLRSCLSTCKMYFQFSLYLSLFKCGKFDEDIDNCPFQATPDVNNGHFMIAADPWRTKSKVLNDT
ncbi:hypothetical protein K5549_017775, partial [Capra hircus]